MSRLGVVTGFQRFSTRLFPESERGMFQFPEFLLFDTFLKLGYYSLVIPFRFQRNSSSEGGGGGGQYQVKVQGHILQRILSTSIYSVGSIRLLFKMDLKRNPSEAFAVIFGVMKHSLPLVWFYTFWIRRQAFVKLLLVCQTKSSVSMHLAQALSSRMIPSSGGNLDSPGLPGTTMEQGMTGNNFVSWKLALAARLFTLLAFSKLAMETLYSYYNYRSGSDEFYGDGGNLRWSEKNLFVGGNDTRNRGFLEHILINSHCAGHFVLGNAHLLEEKKNETLTLTLDRMLESPWDLAFTLAVLLCGTVQDYVVNMVDAFCFIGAALVFSICSRFTEHIPNTSSSSRKESKELQLERIREDPAKFLKVLERMSMEYLEVSNVAETANGIFGPIFLLYILGAFPSLGGFMMFKQWNAVTGEKLNWIAIVYSVTMHVSVTMTASEGTSKMGDYKSWLFDVSLVRKRPTVWRSEVENYQVPALSNAVLSRLNHLHREVTSDTVGLKGCGFFTMTYGLIGTLVSLFVTFAIVIVQFEMDMSKK